MNIAFVTFVTKILKTVHLSCKVGEYTNCSFKLYLCCDLGLVVRINKQKDCSWFVMRTVFTGGYLMKSVLFLKNALLLC